MSVGMTFEEFAEVYRAWKAYNRPATTEAAVAPSRRKRTRRQLSSGARWTENDKRNLLVDYMAGLTVKQLARKYGRSEDAIKSRLEHPQYGQLHMFPAPPAQAASTLPGIEVPS